jgi:hypothetical protein
MFSTASNAARGQERGEGVSVQWAVARMRQFWRDKCLEKALVMMGHCQKQTELWVEPANLGRRIPQDHLLRSIRCSSLVSCGERRQVSIGNNGNVSVDPVIIIKLMLLLESIRRSVLFINPKRTPRDARRERSSRPSSSSMRWSFAPPLVVRNFVQSKVLAHKSKPCCPASRAGA